MKKLFVVLFVMVSCVEDHSALRYEASQNAQYGINKYFAEKQNTATELRKTQNCPLVIIDSKLEYNTIGIPVASLELFNDSDKNITGFEVDIFCFNEFGDPVRYYNHGINRYTGYMKDNTIIDHRPGTISWTLYGFDRTNSIKNLKIRRILFEDGTKWVNKY